MKYRKTIYLVAAVMAISALAACGNSGEEPSKQKLRQDQNAPRYEIRFTSNLTGLDAEATRASGNFTTYTMGQEFWVWSDMYDDTEKETSPYFNAWQLTVSSINSKFVTNSSKSFPAYNWLHFYTIHGNFSETFEEEDLANDDPGTEWPTVLYHSVKTEQLKEADYQESDLVYAINRNMVPSSDPVNLEFKHLLSQVEVALVAGKGLTVEELSNSSLTTKPTVELLDVKTKVEFRPSKEAEMDTYAKREQMLSNASEVANITMSAVATDDISKPTCGAAVVVPQTVNGNFIRISYLGCQTYVKVNNLRLKSGFRYRFNVTVDRLGGTHEFTPVTVETWGTATSESLWLDTVPVQEQ